MAVFDWKSFLWRWSEAILESMDGDERAALPQEVVESGWLGFPGASEKQIAQTEARLRVKFPPSYREFLKVTNGWRQTTPFIRRLWSTEGIERFALRHQKWIDDFTHQNDNAPLDLDGAIALDDFWEAPSVSDADYFIYGDEQDCSKLRVEYLKTAIEISDVGESSIYLLNPQVVTEDGEWEAWFFGDWLPGADRYPSFQAMMEAEYQNFLELRNTPLETDEPWSDAIALEAPPEPTPEEPAAEESIEVWRSQTRLIVEFQSRHNGERVEYRTVATAQGDRPPSVWSGLGERKLQQWLQEELNKEINPIAPKFPPAPVSPIPLPEASAPPPPCPPAPPLPPPPLDLTLEIDQLAIRQDTRHPANIVVKPAARKTGYGSLTSQQPFACEVVLNLVGQNLADLRNRPARYEVQFHAQNRTTGEWIVLGKTRPDELVSDRRTYTAYLFGNSLDSGMYRLQVLITLRGSAIALTSFELPLLNVV